MYLYRTPLNAALLIILLPKFDTWFFLNSWKSQERAGWTSLRTECCRITSRDFLKHLIKPVDPSVHSNFSCLSSTFPSSHLSRITFLPPNLTPQSRTRSLPLPHQQSPAHNIGLLLNNTERSTKVSLTLNGCSGCVCRGRGFN